MLHPLLHPMSRYGNRFTTALVWWALCIFAQPSYQEQRLEPHILSASSSLSPQQLAALQAMALDFWSKEGKEFGIQNPQEELRWLSVDSDQLGRQRLVYQQLYENVPVFGMLLYIHFNAQQSVIAANGHYLPISSLNATPVLTAGDAIQIAMQEVQRSGGAGTPSFATNLGKIPVTKLVVYRTNLGRNLPGTDHLAYAVEMHTDPQLHVTLFVDAHKGHIIDRLEHIHPTLRREIYVSSVSPGNLSWQEGDVVPYTGANATDVNRVIEYTEDIYNLMYTLSGGLFDAWDSNGATMQAVINYPTGCPNAFWNEDTAYFCAGLTSDDVVSHEWAHGYSDSTHNFFYAWQPGALSEAYSDIWGEVADRLNGAGTDLPGGPRSSNACSAFGQGSNTTDLSYRWLVGEDAIGGALRDMWNPTCYNNPGKVSDTQYWCNTGDSGGVHINSGVPNHAFALLVDGGIYNGVTIAGIGMTRAAHIYWRAQSVYQTPISNFTDHADALEQSCLDLIDAP